MSLIDRQLREIWDALRAEGAQRRDSLRVTRIKHLRGIRGSSSTVSLPRLRVGRSQRLWQVHRAVRLRVRLFRIPTGGRETLPPSSLFPMTTSSSAETPGATSFQATSEPWESSASRGTSSWCGFRVELQEQINAWRQES